jgi:antirestriction protein
MSGAVVFDDQNRVTGAVVFDERLHEVPDSLRPYVQFDYEGFARDMELSGDITTSDGDGGVYIFEGTR